MVKMSLHTYVYRIQMSTLVVPHILWRSHVDGGWMYILLDKQCQRGSLALVFLVIFE